MAEEPNRRWFRFAFSLRTLFVVVTVLGCWLGYQVNWIRERHSLIVGYGDEETVIACPVEPGTAPWSLRLLGERGWKYMYVPSPHPKSKMARLQRASPEADFDHYLRD